MSSRAVSINVPRRNDRVSSKPRSPIKPRRRVRPSREFAEWRVDARWAPPRRLSDKELENARKIFFELDIDGSGSIDADELGAVMRSLGQSPTEQELAELIKSVDEGDKDGKLQLREFLKLYVRGLDTREKVGAKDVNDCFSALGGNDDDEGQASVSVEGVREKLLAEFGLELDDDSVFGVSGKALTKKDLEALLLAAE